MFSGIVEAVGTVTGSVPREDGIRLVIRTPEPLAGLPPSTSVCVSGTCLTVVETTGEGLAFDAVGATLRRTRLGELRPGDPVNLERSLRLGGALDGHLVTGHVDGLGTVTGREPGEGAVFLEIEVPGGLETQIAARGSVTVDGVSLTVAEAHGRRFRVSLVPYTLEATTLDALGPGDKVHLETDILAKYVQRLLETRSGDGVRDLFLTEKES